MACAPIQRAGSLFLASKEKVAVLFIVETSNAVIPQLDARYPTPRLLIYMLTVLLILLVRQAQLLLQRSLLNEVKINTFTLIVLW